MPETIVIALGGNAITRPGERGTIPQQFEHTRESLELLLPVFRSDRRIVITHGNGPQIGNILIRVEEGERRVPPLPLDTCVSDSQGGMGYMIQRLATDIFRRERIRRDVVSVITEVIVDRDDPDFQNPTKPVGSYYTAKEMEKIREEKPHWLMREVQKGKFRRVVPSPKPIEVVEKASIKALIDAGVIVIACGGGGIPVAWNEEGRLIGVEAVIDKDYASSLLATQIRANRLIIVTSVEQAAIRYEKPDQRWLETITLGEAKQYLEAGEFAPGSMGPKIRAAIDFIEQGGEECIITSTERVPDALAGSAGTRIVASWSSEKLAFEAVQP
jgi:carbamate kinase